MRCADSCSPLTEMIVTVWEYIYVCSWKKVSVLSWICCRVRGNKKGGFNFAPTLVLKYSSFIPLLKRHYSVMLFKILSFCSRHFHRLFLSTCSVYFLFFAFSFFYCFKPSVFFKCWETEMKKTKKKKKWRESFLTSAKTEKPIADLLLCRRMRQPVFKRRHLFVFFILSQPPLTVKLPLSHPFLLPLLRRTFSFTLDAISGNRLCFFLSMQCNITNFFEICAFTTHSFIHLLS